MHRSVPAFSPIPVALLIVLVFTGSSTTVPWGATSPRSTQQENRQATPATRSASEQCRAADLTDARALLRQAVEVVGLNRTDGQVLHFTAMQFVEQDFQSERTYPPYFSFMQSVEVWYDPSTGVERQEGEFVYPNVGPRATPAQLLSERGSYVVRDTTRQPIPASSSPLNAWAVLQTWSQAPDVRVAEECLYRDYWRVVLSRPGEHGEERLYVDSKTGFPVKLDVIRPHYLWGQVHVEYLYSLWQQIGSVFVPSAAFKIEDGRTNVSRTVGHRDLVAPEEAPSLELPENPVRVEAQVPPFLRPTPVDTVRVGPNTYLLQNPGYTEAVTLVGDTIYVFDATQGEERARRDHEWIRTLFPGDHPIVVFVTDLAWPHVAGVRYWVAQGATIISHRLSRDFLQKIVDRRWTMEPDLLERRREEVSLRFVGIDAAHDLAEGRIRLAPIDGIGSEGALIVYLPDTRFLWAGDYIQRLDQPTAYTTEVKRAVERAGLRPKAFAAQHVPLTAWDTIQALYP